MILEGEIELVAHLLVHRRAMTQMPPGSASAFEPRRDVDAVAEDVAVLDDDVADIDADAELDAPLRRHVGVALGHPALHLDGAAHRIDDAGELDQQAVAGGLDDAAAVLGDLRIDQLAAMRLAARASVPSSSAPISRQ